MKIIFLLISTLFLAACGETTSGVDPLQTQKRIDQQLEKQQEVKEDIVSDIPDWWLNPPMDTQDIFYFVGSGESKQLQMSLDIAILSIALASSSFASRIAMSKQLQMSLDIAILEAKEELASAIDSTLRSQTTKFITQSGLEDDMVLTSSLEEATKAIIRDTQVGGYRVAKKDVQAKGNKYMAYVLLEYIAGHANKLLYNQIKKDAETEAKIRQTEAFKELEEAVLNS